MQPARIDPQLNGGWRNGQGPSLVEMSDVHADMTESNVDFC